MFQIFGKALLYVLEIKHLSEVYIFYFFILNLHNFYNCSINSITLKVTNIRVIFVNSLHFTRRMLRSWDNTYHCRRQRKSLNFSIWKFNILIHKTQLTIRDGWVCLFATCYLNLIKSKCLCCDSLSTLVVIINNGRRKNAFAGNDPAF